MVQFAEFNSIATNDAIDGAAGIIRGVVVISKGEAKGHDGLTIDDKAINQFLQLAKEHKDGIKVRFGKDHDAGADDICGILKNFYRSGDRVRADLHVLKADEHYEKIMEMARILPNEFGLSASTSATDETIDDVRYVRFSDIFSVDIVSNPAATDGLFFSDGGHGGYLVEKDGQKHLPTHKNGKADHRLMGAAWAALHGGYRGNKYEGPGKQEAISKLKALYKREGMEPPGEEKSNYSNTMKKILALSLNLSAEATDEEILTAFAAKCKASGMDADAEAEAKKEMKAKLDADDSDGDDDDEGADGETAKKKSKKHAKKFDGDADDEEKAKQGKKELSEIQSKITELDQKIAEFSTKAQESAAAAKKAEVSALLAEATRDGKVVPLTEKVLLSLEISDVKDMISKLPKGQLKLERGTKPTDKSGKEITDKNSPEFRAFMAARKEEGALKIGERMVTLNN